MITVDALGDVCPTPVIKTKKAIAGLTGEELVEVLVDNETAVKNVSKFGAESGGVVTTETLAENKFKVKIQLSGQPTIKDNAKKKTLVVVNSATMGHGNDELGAVLIKGFLYAVSQLDVLPQKLLFYNGGAKLTCEGSAALEDLQYLAGQGVEIMTCGTCLDYYGLKDSLKVGTVTNMYSIVEAMNEADQVIRP